MPVQKETGAQRTPNVRHRIASGLVWAFLAVVVVGLCLWVAVPELALEAPPLIDPKHSAACRPDCPCHLWRAAMKRRDTPEEQRAITDLWREQDARVIRERAKKGPWRPQRVPAVVD
jgi:hypothetical protein